MTRYLQRTYRVAPGQEELLAAELWEQGTLGLETRASDGGDTLVLAFFTAAGAPPAREVSGAQLLAEEPLAEGDWLARYRELARPIEIGDRLVIDPREPGPLPPVAPGRTLLRLPARSAFGTGSHASTRLALLLLETLPVSGWRVLDVGTGSAILALAAMRFGASAAVGFDVDSGAVMVARESCRLNRGAGVSLFAGTSAALSRECRFDLALVNVEPHRIEPEVPAIVERVRPAGVMVVSGFLTVDEARVQATWARAGARVQRLLAEEEWGAALLERVRP